MRTQLLASLLLIGCTSDPRLDTSQQATTVCGGSATVQGMDVSVYETSIDWPTAKAAGIQFAFIRATDGLGYVDPSFAGYWAGAKAAGVLRGAYQFFRPAEDPVAQAELLLSTIGTLEPGDLPPVIDVETTGGLTPAEVATSVGAWVDNVAAIIGRPPIIYAGFYSWQDDVGGANLTAEPLWHAQYTDEPCPNIPVPWTSWAFWQYSSTGTVPAVLGETTDLDVWNGDLASLQAFTMAGLPPCGILDASGGLVDDGDACFATGGDPTYLRDATDAGYGGDLVWTHATDAAAQSNFAQWNLTLAEAGTYRVEVYTAAAYAQSKAAAYVVDAAGRAQTVVIDQSAVDGWQSLGTFAFAAGGGQYVHLGDNTGEAGDDVQLVFDAVRLTRTDAPPAAGPDAGVDAPTATSTGGGCDAGGGGGAGGLAVALLTWSRRARRRRATSPCPRASA